LVVEILPEAIGTGLGAAGGPIGAAIGGASGVAAKELLRRATAAEKEHAGAAVSGRRLRRP
jgi:hypothetical protein